MLLVIATMYLAVCESCNLIKAYRELIAFSFKEFKNMNNYTNNGL